MNATDILCVSYYFVIIYASLNSVFPFSYHTFIIKCNGDKVSEEYVWSNTYGPREK